MDFPKITIITPSFNQGQFIEQTIQSVIEQDYPNCEYFIIDGGSTDNTVNIIEKYQKYITYWVSEKDQGQSDAINKGLKLATGEIINWLNSDDYYMPNSLFKVAETFNKMNAKIVCGRSRLFEKNRTIRYSNGTDIYPDNLPKTIGWARIDQPETFFHRSVIERIGLLEINLHYLMDRVWWIKYLFTFGLNNIIKIPDVLVNFRLHPESKTFSKISDFQTEQDNFFYSLAIQNKFNSLAELIRKNTTVDKMYHFEWLKQNDENLVEAGLNYYLLLRGNEFYTQNDRIKAAAFLKNVKVNLLSHYDQQLLKKLCFRNKYMPFFILNLFRKIGIHDN